MIVLGISYSFYNCSKAVNRNNQITITGMGKVHLQEAFIKSNVPLLKTKNRFETISFLCL